MKRWLITIAIFVLAGAVLNVAVAWGCALGMSVPNPIVDSVPLDTEEAREIAEDLVPSVEMGVTVAVAVESSFGTALDLIQTARHDPDLKPLALEDLQAPDRDAKIQEFSQGAYTVNASRVRAGWPILALCGYTVVEINWNTKIKSTRELGAVYVFQRILPIPLRPIWLGFIANTVFYAAILWLVIAGSFVLRRVIRVRGGRCGACGYPMGESGICSECGKPLVQ